MNVVYNSFAGRYSDSPRALHRTLVERGVGSNHVWLADPSQLGAFPDEVATVAHGEPESVAALEAADLLVANTHTEIAWRKRPDAVYLQTWHGTPLKRIHWDVLWAPEGRLARLSRDVEMWDYLVSPNRVSTPHLRSAFRYEGEVLETGYPRNDVLSAPERDDVRARVRAALGIADGVTAVLYAPTWRDDVVFGGRAARDVTLELDVDAFAGRFGDTHKLLLRLHYMVTGRLSAARHDSVVDVSAHPDISELYLAADVLVTDYSSAMFDFAITGKPQVFYVYDLADYADRLRGFYFDLVPIAPGPLVETNAELLDALGDVEAAAPRYEERYAALRERFCHLEDGRAGDRLVERLMEDRRLSRPTG